MNTRTLPFRKRIDENFGDLFFGGYSENGFKYGRHGRFRTADLYRVKVALHP